MMHGGRESGGNSRRARNPGRWMGCDLKTARGWKADRAGNLGPHPRDRRPAGDDLKKARGDELGGIGPSPRYRDLNGAGSVGREWDRARGRRPESETPRDHQHRAGDQMTGEEQPSRRPATRRRGADMRPRQATACSCLVLSRGVVSWFVDADATVTQRSGRRGEAGVDGHAAIPACSAIVFAGKGRVASPASESSCGTKLRQSINSPRLAAARIIFSQYRGGMFPRFLHWRTVTPLSPMSAAIASALPSQMA